MVIVDSLDERLLDCAFCGKKFFDTPDMALFGWDDDAPIYACMACDTAQQCLHADAGESAPLQALSTPKVDSIGGADSTPTPPTRK